VTVTLNPVRCDCPVHSPGMLPGVVWFRDMVHSVTYVTERVMASEDHMSVERGWPIGRRTERVTVAVC
jgi:hypothetical protein